MKKIPWGTLGIIAAGVVAVMLFSKKGTATSMFAQKRTPQMKRTASALSGFGHILIGKQTSNFGRK